MGALRVAFSVYVATVTILRLLKRVFRTFLKIQGPLSKEVEDYVSLAKEMNRNPEHGIFRRFGELNNFGLLYMQDELASLERQYLTQRESDQRSDCAVNRTYSLSMEHLRQSEGEGSKQRDLLLEILPKLKAYNEALAAQITSQTYSSPGSSDIRDLRRLTAVFPMIPKENLWKVGLTPAREREILNDFVVLSPVSASRSPFSASRADQGLVYKIERPFRVALAFTASVFFVLWWLTKELFARKKPYYEEDGIETHNRKSDNRTSGTNASNRPNPSLGTQDRNIQSAKNARTPTDSSIRNTTTDPLDNGTITQEPNQPSGERIIEAPDLDNSRITSEGREELQSTAVIGQTAHSINGSQDSLAHNAPQSGTEVDISTAAHKQTANSNTSAHKNANRVSPEEFFGITEPVTRQNSIKSGTKTQGYEERFNKDQIENQFARELSRLDRDHGPDLKSSMLSALFTTLPVLVLYYIHSLPFRLLAVILFTLTFALGLSLTYKPKRGEVFATTAAFAAVQVVFVGSSTI